MFLANQRLISHNFLLCRPSQRSARSQVPSQVATNQKIGSQLWAGETLDLNPGLQDNSQERYHWATMAPRYVQMYVQQDHPLVIEDRGLRHVRPPPVGGHASRSLKAREWKFKGYQSV